MNTHLQASWNNSEFVYEVVKALTLMGVVLIVNYYAVRYATVNASLPVADLFLSNIDRVDTSWLDYTGAMILQYIVILIALVRPKYLLFFLYSASLLILTRCIFINLTYLGIPPEAIPTQSFFTQGGDLFFSGHTALPFLAALIYWEIRKLRYFFLLATILFGVEVILGHHHYTIDVVAAPFITYGVYVFATKFFASQYAMIQR